MASICSHKNVENDIIWDAVPEESDGPQESETNNNLDSVVGALGVVFPHPAFAIRFQPLSSAIDKSKKVTNEIWPIFETNSGCTDDTTIPQRRTVVQTDTFDSLGSTGSSSLLYPTDEQSNIEEDSFDCKNRILGSVTEGALRIIHYLRSAHAYAVEVQTSHLDELDDAQEDPVREPMIIEDSIQVHHGRDL